MFMRWQSFWPPDESSVHSQKSASGRPSGRTESLDSNDLEIAEMNMGGGGGSSSKAKGGSSILDDYPKPSDDSPRLRPAGLAERETPSPTARRGKTGGMAMSGAKSPPSGKFRRKSAGGSAGGPSKETQFRTLADVGEILGERGRGNFKEMLVKWRGLLSSRPSWVLLIELKKNPSFRDVYEQYKRDGEAIVKPLEEAEAEIESEERERKEMGEAAWRRKRLSEGSGYSPISPSRERRQSFEGY